MIWVNREYVYSVAVYKKKTTSNEVGRIDNFRALAQTLSILPTELNIFLYTTALCTYSIYLSKSDLLSFVISNTDKHEFSSIKKWIRCCNDVMNNVDCVIKRVIYLQKMHSCSKNTRGISVFVLKISVVYKKMYIMGDTAWIFV